MQYPRVEDGYLQARYLEGGGTSRMGAAAIGEVRGENISNPSGYPATRRTDSTDVGWNQRKQQTWQSTSMTH